MGEGSASSSTARWGRRQSIRRASAMAAPRCSSAAGGSESQRASVGALGFCVQPNWKGKGQGFFLFV